MRGLKLSVGLTVFVRRPTAPTDARLETVSGTDSFCSGGQLPHLMRCLKLSVGLTVLLRLPTAPNDRVQPLSGNRSFVRCGLSLLEMAPDLSQLARVELHMRASVYVAWAQSFHQVLSVF